MLDKPKRVNIIREIR